MPQQTILFTVMPRGLSVNTKTLPVSVLVSPRLMGASNLGSFPDWLDWTQQLKDNGLSITFRSGTHTHTMPIERTVLHPELWQAMFNRDTYVRTHTFNDYTRRAIFSYPVRLALSAIKSMYQESSVALGLPDRNASPEKDQQESAYRRFIKGLLSGMEVNWTDEAGEKLRQAYRDRFGHPGLANSSLAAHYDPSWLAPDGTLKILAPSGTSASTNFHQFVATQFAVYSHMPQGASIQDNPPNFDTLIDFHQALSSLNSYPELLRALGLVFDFELPADFLTITAINTPGKLSAVDLPQHAWAIPTQAVPNLPPLETAYLYFEAGDPAHPFKVFATAPALIGGVLPDLEVFGLLNIDPRRYGLAQVDVESGMNKTIFLAESWQDSRLGLAPADHPEVFDETTTLPSLRSGGLSLFADGRALRLLNSFQQNKQFNTDLENNTPQKRPFYAEDLVHGYRLDIWDSFTNQWYSLHRRKAAYQIGDQNFAPPTEVEGFIQLAAGQAAPDPHNPPPNDLYLNESISRWTGWSLSAPFPGKQLSDDPDPDKALVDDPNHPANEPATPFKMTTAFTAAAKSLPSLRFGRRYRLRVRPVDLAGNSMKYDDPLAALLALLAGLPRDPEGFAYLRYEPVAAPIVVLRDLRAVTGPGSQLNRLVMHTYNSDVTKDGDPADLTASDRFIAPPSTSVEVGERMGMFDKNGKLVNSPAMYTLIGQRDQGRLNQVEAVVAGKKQSFPLESGQSLDVLPYLPDVLASGAALRDLPGAPDESLASVQPGGGASAPLPYEKLGDANPRPGSAALISFNGGDDWQKLLPFRLALADGNQAPTWDPQQRVLTVFLPKGVQAIVPLSSYLQPDQLKLMGVWQWLREYIDQITVQQPGVPALNPMLDVEKIAHLLQRAVEGGHWMITPPRLLTLIHAVQQPIGMPAFTAISAQHQPYGSPNAWGELDEKLNPDPNVLQTAPEGSPTAESEEAAITAWRKPGSQEAYLLGGLKIHAGSTEKIDLLAEWSDPTDDPTQARLPGQDYQQKNTANADEIPIPSTKEGTIVTGQGTSNYRAVAYYDADHDLLCFARNGDELGNLKSGQVIYEDAAPRHYFNDTRYHRVQYTAKATSRYREYFPQDQNLDFTRSSEPVTVEVPASARPATPQVSYVVPTFGWQRQSETNLKRSVRFGGGLRVYLERPWFSSGAGELLGVTLYDYQNGTLTDRELWKAYITQWGADPIWKAQGLNSVPESYNFTNNVANEDDLSLPGRAPGRVAVAGFPVAFDFDSQKWFSDLIVDTSSLAYTPFIRLALVRYQPFALPDAKLSPVQLADYAQLTPERSAVITADPYHPRSLCLTVSGPAPSSPPPLIHGTQPTQPITVPTLVTVTVQERNPAIQTDLGWQDAPSTTASIAPLPINPAGLVRWTGTVNFATMPQTDQYRVLIREYEYLPANYTIPSGPQRGRRAQREQPKRLIYAETMEIDTALIGGPATGMGTTL
jgi:hypothetical protein